MIMLALLPLLTMLGGCMSALQAAADRRDERIHALANGGNAEAQYHVGMFFNNGMGGMTRDPRVAFEWFGKAAAGGDALGAYKVGCHYAGQFPGTVEVDQEKALTHKLVAAKQVMRSPNTMWASFTSIARIIRNQNAGGSLPARRDSPPRTTHFPRCTRRTNPG